MFFFGNKLQVEMLRREEMMLRSMSGQNLGIPSGVLQYEKQKKLIRGPGGEYRGKGTGVFIPRTSVKNNVGGAARATRTREGGKIYFSIYVIMSVCSELKWLPACNKYMFG